jgi:hypothetical protein
MWTWRNSTTNVDSTSQHVTARHLCSDCQLHLLSLCLSQRDWCQCTMVKICASRQTSVKTTNIRFHKNRYSGSRSVHAGRQTDRQTGRKRHRQRERQTDRHTDWQRQTDRHTDWQKTVAYRNSFPKALQPVRIKSADEDPYLPLTTNNTNMATAPAATLVPRDY